MTLTRFNGNLYWKNRRSAKGWGKQISNFHILDAKLNSKRYIAHDSYNNIKYQPFEESRDAIIRFARQFGLAVSPVYETVDDVYTNIPYYERWKYGDRQLRGITDLLEWMEKNKTAFIQRT